MNGPIRGTGSAKRSAAKPGRATTGAPQPTERRPLTVMFCDIVDSVSLSQRLDPEDLMALIERYQTLCDDIVSDRGGFLAKAAAGIIRAAHEVGFFQLVGHGIEPAESDALFGLVRRFFALPEADRLALDKRRVLGVVPGATLALIV